MKPSRLLIVAVLVLLACSRQPDRTEPIDAQPARNEPTAGQPNPAQPALGESKHVESSIGKLPADLPFDDAALTRIACNFTFDVGDVGEAAWQRLRSCPRKWLIAELTRIQQSTDDDDFRGCIAFVFCNLGHRYKPNRAVIVSIFNKSFDNAAEFTFPMGRLIQRGDRTLLQPLFDIAPRSDGHFSEELSGIFADQMQTYPRSFLKLLQRQPRKIRQAVNEGVAYGTWDSDQLANLKRYLSSVPRNSPLAATAKEMLRALSKTDDWDR